VEYFAFTYTRDWREWPLPEWMEWVYRLGGQACIVAVGKDDVELTRLAKDFNVNLTYVRERDIRFMDPRAYYKLLAELTCSPGLKFMLDIDEFPISRPEVDPPRGRSVGIVHMPSTWDKAPNKEVLFFDSSRTTREYEELRKESPTVIPLNAYKDDSRQMARIFKGYAGVRGDGGDVDLPIDSNVKPVHILNIIRNEKELINRSWAWKFGYRHLTSDDITKVFPLKWVKIDMPDELANILERFRKRVSEQAS
jgi:hypothetical protein